MSVMISSIFVRMMARCTVNSIKFIVTFLSVKSVALMKDFQFFVNSNFCCILPEKIN